MADGKRIWLMAPGEGAQHWGEWREKGIVCIGWDGVTGDLRGYRERDQLNGRVLDKGFTKVVALAHWEFCRVMEPGDVIFIKKGKSHVLGRGVVKSDYRFDETRPSYQHVRDVDWKSHYAEGVKVGDKLLPNKALTDYTKRTEKVATIERALQIGETTPEPSRFTLNDAKEDLFLGNDEIQSLVELLRRKKNIILQGPPGTGKTFLAQRLAWLLAGERSKDRIEIVQFHQSYGYEDFVRGYRPTEDGGFELQDGPFLRFCERAGKAPDRPHVLIVDEINRGDLSRIFGELLMLIEADKRDSEWAVRTAYARPDEPTFHVPENLHLIGTMNTADRSLALVDYALRRRFAFRTVCPAFESAGFKRHLDQHGVLKPLRDRIRKRIAVLNENIRKHPQLGAGFEIGHSYFCETPGKGSDHDDWYRNVVIYEIEPLLEEYWFDEEGKVKESVQDLLAD